MAVITIGIGGIASLVFHLSMNPLDISKNKVIVMINIKMKGKALSK